MCAPRQAPHATALWLACRKSLAKSNTPLMHDMLKSSSSPNQEPPATEMQCVPKSSANTPQWAYHHAATMPARAEQERVNDSLGGRSMTVLSAVCSLSLR